MVLQNYDTFKKIINYLNEIDNTEVNEEKLNRALKQTEFKKLQDIERKHLCLILQDCFVSELRFAIRFG